MKIITGFLFLLNIVFWIVFDVLCWWLTGATMGVVLLIGIVSFLIAWGISGEASLSISDYIMQSEWGIFVSKIKWANMTALIIMSIFVIICLTFDWLDLRSFLNIPL